MMFHETAGHACMSAARRTLSVLAVLAALTAGCSQDVAEPRDVVRAIKTFRIPAPEAEVGETVVTTYRYPAKISAVARVVEMAFEVSGKLVECSVSEGREVKAGQLLARLDAPGIADALDTARAQRDRAEADRDRAIAADQSETGSKQNVAEAEARLNAATAEVRAKQRALAQSELRAPFDLRVARKLVQEPADVEANEPILILEDAATVEAIVDIPESEWAMVRNLAALHGKASPMTKLQIVVKAFPDRSFDADLSVIVTTADPVTGTVAATATFGNPGDIAITPGMPAEVIVQTSVAVGEERPSVPANAVGSGDFPYVWLLDTETMQVSRRYVEIGGRVADGEIEIRRGLTAGDEIAVSGVKQLREGVRVRRLGE